MNENATPQPPDRETVVELSDGRRVGTAEWGPEDGTAIFWFHGTPGARRQIPPKVREEAHRDNVRMIGLERPGVGASTAHRYPSLTDFAADVDEVADRRSVDRYGAIGLSGGGPYVLACAHEHSDRMIAGASLGGVAPVSGPQAASGGPLALARFLNPVLRTFHEPLGWMLSAAVRALHPVSHTAIELYASVGPGADARVLRVPHMREMFLDDLLEGSRTQIRSVIYDFILFTDEWDVDLRTIEIPVRFYQGDDDFYVPLSHGAHLASMLPNGSLEYRPGTGHLDGFAAGDAAVRFIVGHADDQAGGATAAAKKPDAKQPAAKKPAAKQPPAKKPAAKQPPAKKPAAKKPPAKKPAAKQPAAKKRAAAKKATATMPATTSRADSA